MKEMKDINKKEIKDKLNQVVLVHKFHNKNQIGIKLIKALNKYNNQNGIPHLDNLKMQLQAEEVDGI
jgi:hypothetical protein